MPNEFVEGALLNRQLLLASAIYNIFPVENLNGFPTMQPGLPEVYDIVLAFVIEILVERVAFWEVMVEAVNIMLPLVTLY